VERQTIVAQADTHLRAPVEKPQWLERTSGNVWVGGQPVGGYVSLWVDVWSGVQLPEHSAFIDHMALDAHAYHPGLGRALIETAWLWAQEHKANRLLALVPRYDPVGQAFWRSLHARSLDDVSWLHLFGYQVFQVIS
jgi:GNAT superfamily N-acetyltransferase